MFLSYLPIIHLIGFSLEAKQVTETHSTKHIVAPVVHPGDQWRTRRTICRLSRSAYRLTLIDNLFAMYRRTNLSVSRETRHELVETITGIPVLPLCALMKLRICLRLVFEHVFDDAV